MKKSTVLFSALAFAAIMAVSTQEVKAQDCKKAKQEVSKTDKKVKPQIQTSSQDNTCCKKAEKCESKDDCCKKDKSVADKKETGVKTESKKEK